MTSQEHCLVPDPQRNRRRAILVLALFALSSAGCIGRQMGDPIKADPAIPAAETRTAVTAAQASTALPPAQSPSKARSDMQQSGDQWELAWQRIQAPSDTVGWVEHFRVCGLKYRFRNYDHLFRCLDLFEAKLEKNEPPIEDIDWVRPAAPVLTGWMRAAAYGELGEPEVALKWVESAWQALPEAYRTVDSSVMSPIFSEKNPRGNFVHTAMSAGGGWQAYESAIGAVKMTSRVGRDNPAALDMNPENIAMTLAAQRSLLYQHLGDAQKAQAALAELRRWEEVRQKDFLTLFVPTQRVHRPKAMLLSMGPLFSMGEYGRVVGIYDEVSSKIESQRQREAAIDTVSWTLFLPWMLMAKGTDAALRPFTPDDARLYSVALEDASNALIYAASLVRLGRSAEARAMLDTLLAMPEIRAMGNLYWVALYERGLIALAEGKRADGISLLTQSVAAIEAVRNSISVEAAKIGFAGDKQAVYGALVSALAEAGEWQQAFLFAERAKARALVDLLAERRDLAPPPGADDKVREIFTRATTDEAGLGFPTTGNAVRGIKLVADARNSLATVAPETASLVSVQRVAISDIAARIREDETLIDYYSHADRLHAFVLTRSTVKGFTLSAKGLEQDIRAFRAAIETRDARTAEISRVLHDRLIRPLLPDIKGRALTISPHGALHYLPFAALSDGREYLIDRSSIRFTPSANALVYLRTGRPAKTGRLLALGNPDLGNSRYDLPNAQAEATNVAAMFPDSRALLRADASKSAVKELGGGFAMLHFATHGKFDTDAPLSSGLYLAPGSEPSGVLTVGDLYSLRWDTDLVTLSACETGLGKVANGDDVIGLTRGFLYAGARSIVASLWEVDDAATAQLMVSFYRNLDRRGKREALRLAQIETRERHPEPRYWAAFQLLGRDD